jgi:hypothetical protein
VVPKKKVDAKKLEKNIKDTKAKKAEEVKQNLSAVQMNKFRMPTAKPKVGKGFTEKDLEK